VGIWEIRLEIRHDAPLARVSAEHATTPMHLWAMGRNGWVQIVSEDDGEVGRIATSLERLGIRILDGPGLVGDRLLRVQYSALDDRGLVNLFATHQCQVIAPWTYLAGWAHYRVLSFGEEPAHELFRSLRAFPEWKLVRKVELSSTTPPTPIWVESLLNGLTERQVHAFQQAHRAGYYRSPRRTTLASIASHQGVGRSTFEEHLRLAQNRILINLAELAGSPLGEASAGRRPARGSRRRPFGGPARRGPPKGRPGR
jgi:predicted DNA binding protein